MFFRFSLRTIIIAFLLALFLGLTAHAQVQSGITPGTSNAPNLNITVPGDLRYSTSYDYTDQQGFSALMTYILLAAAVASAGLGALFFLWESEPEKEKEAAPAYAAVKHA